LTCTGFQQIRADIPKVREIIIFDGTPAEGMHAAIPLIEAVGGEELAVNLEEDAGTMIYTSGTIGKPKGAVRYGAGNPEQVAGCRSGPD